MWAKRSLRFYNFVELYMDEKNVSNHMNPRLAFQDFYSFFKLKTLEVLHQKSMRYGMFFMKIEVILTHFLMLKDHTAWAWYDFANRIN